MVTTTNHSETGKDFQQWQKLRNTCIIRFLGERKNTPLPSCARVCSSRTSQHTAHTNENTVCFFFSSQPAADDKHGKQQKPHQKKNTDTRKAKTKKQKQNRSVVCRNDDEIESEKNVYARVWSVRKKETRERERRSWKKKSLFTVTWLTAWPCSPPFCLSVCVYVCNMCLAAFPLQCKLTRAHIQNTSKTKKRTECRVSIYLSGSLSCLFLRVVFLEFFFSSFQRTVQRIQLRPGTVHSRNNSKFNPTQWLAVVAIVVMVVVVVVWMFVLSVYVCECVCGWPRCEEKEKKGWELFCKLVGSREVWHVEASLHTHKTRAHEHTMVVETLSAATAHASTHAHAHLVLLFFFFLPQHQRPTAATQT